MHANAAAAAAAATLQHTRTMRFFVLPNFTTTSVKLFLLFIVVLRTLSALVLLACAAYTHDSLSSSSSLDGYALMYHSVTVLISFAWFILVLIHPRRLVRAICEAAACMMVSNSDNAGRGKRDALIHLAHQTKAIY